MLDFGDVVVHLFTAEQREYYDLESFYGAAEEVGMHACASVTGHQRRAWLLFLPRARVLAAVSWGRARAGATALRA